MTNSRQLIVTGIPRSGTTLLAALVDSLADAVCLSEPDWQSLWSQEMTDRAAYVNRITRDFERVRATLLAGTAVPDRRDTRLKPVTDYFPRGAGGQRQQTFEVRELRRAGLTPNFLLGMKHNAHYTCVLSELLRVKNLEALAIVRNPVSTILSWRSLKIPIGQGRLPAAERFWPEIPALWQTTNDLLEVQVRIYGLFCQRYKETAGRLVVIKHEELVEDPTMLERLFARRYARHVRVQAQHQSDVQAADETTTIRRYIQKFCPVAYEFYPNLDDPAQR